MKVLIYRYGSICEPDIIQTFCEMGFTVDEYRHEMTEKNDLPSDIVKIFGDCLLDHPCDFVFSINFFPYYLGHEEERREIAQNGLCTLKENYTYEKQLGKLLLRAFEK